MDDRRLEAYLNLIQLLLNCPSGEEAQILQANSELVDAKLVQTILENANNLRIDKKLDDANYLMTIAGHILGIYSNIKLQKLPPFIYLKFTGDLVQKIIFCHDIKSKNWISEIHALLLENINLIDDNLAASFGLICANVLAKLKLSAELDNESITGIATNIGIFSKVMSSFHLGSKGSNLEIAIAGYKITLTVFTHQVSAEVWAMIQNDLGDAYSKRIRGKKADNLEMAIAFYQEALSVRTREAFPQDWVATQNSLGIAYNNRIKGEKADNTEKAIEFHQAALSVYTHEVFPEQWAMTQQNLGDAYLFRIRGKKADNLEMAIAFYQEALSVRTREAFPQDWAATQNSLGIAYSNRIKGEKADNIERAIKFYEAALSISTRDEFPQEWALTQLNLANAYTDRIRGEKKENLKRAILLYFQILSVFTIEEFPEQWASIHNNLAIAYNRRFGEHQDIGESGLAAFNMKTSLELHEAALSVYTRDAYPENWARTQVDLGIAYSKTTKGEKADNIERAIEFYEAALFIYNCENFPEEWARTQQNLANAYVDRIRGEKEDNVKKAIAFCEAALSVYTSHSYPINYTQALYNLGHIYQENYQLPEAYNTFNSVIETVELMRSEIITGGEADRQKLAEEWNKLYQRMVKVCLDMENKTAALEYIERSKTRNLVELFHNARSLPQNVQRISFQEIRSLLGEDEAILEWYITFNSFKVFIITHDSTQPDVWQSSDADLKALEEFQEEYINDYIYQNDNWEKQLENRLEKLAKILHIDKIISHIPKNCQRLILVPFRYLHLLPLHALTSRRVRQNIEETGSLLELFPGGVRYTPSCQLLQLSQRVNPTGEESSPTRLFAIQNPTEDLDFTDIEVEAIAKSFNPAEVLIRKKASKTGFQQQFAALQNAEIAHFSCHGFFDFSNPRKSALILAGAKLTPLNPPLASGETGENFPLPSGETGEDFPLVNGETGEVPPLTKGGLGGASSDKSYIRSRRGETFDIAECLTLEEIFNLSLNKCSLVTLSACETGLTDIRDNTDEYIGLPSGFFYAGATSIISTLWAVNDVSTAILMIRFYEIFLSETRPPVAIALRESQLWLRSLTVKALREWVEESKLLSSKHKQVIKKQYKRGYKQDYQPYEKPLYWAAFCATGQ